MFPCSQLSLMVQGEYLPPFCPARGSSSSERPHLLSEPLTRWGASDMASGWDLGCNSCRRCSEDNTAGGLTSSCFLGSVAQLHQTLAADLCPGQPSRPSLGPGLAPSRLLCTGRTRPGLLAPSNVFIFSASPTLLSQTSGTHFPYFSLKTRIWEV